MLMLQLLPMTHIHDNCYIYTTSQYIILSVPYLSNCIWCQVSKQYLLQYQCSYLNSVCSCLFQCYESKT